MRTKMLAAIVAAALVLGVLLVAVVAGTPGGDEEAGDQSAAGTAEVDLSGIPDVVAVVNGEEIGRDDFVAMYEPQFQQAAAAGQQVNQDDLKQQTLDLMIDNVLLVQEAEASGYSASDEQIEESLQTFATNNAMASVDDYIAALQERQGLSEDQVRAQVADGLVIEALVDDEVGDEPIDESELRSLYDQAVAQQEQQGQTQGGAAEVPSFEEVRPQLEEAAHSQRQRETLTRIVEEAREAAEIDVRL
ncbi:SurA N-terminal domain-containing protein [uncultured Aeromicrobium sp.]|uniref:SurA N-terminal domain-containing protein n=1 Tax=uncultured Aeromicrobium sp. TaxID=337820 RepID=UPI0025DA7436|nr:SurA N-terminal domain-containing protein [uncultured Aeromicrobium sp.]